MQRGGVFSSRYVQHHGSLEGVLILVEMLNVEVAIIAAFPLVPSGCSVEVYFPPVVCSNAAADLTGRA